MKALWTILLSLALVFGSGALAAPPRAAAAKVCPCKQCHCGDACGCVDQAPASPRPAPAGPVHPANPGNDLALLFSTASCLSLTLRCTTGAEAAGPTAPFSFPGVPLRTRHCCFLL